MVAADNNVVDCTNGEKTKVEREQKKKKKRKEEEERMVKTDSWLDVKAGITGSCGNAEKMLGRSFLNWGDV